MTVNRTQNVDKCTPNFNLQNSLIVKRRFISEKPLIFFKKYNEMLDSTILIQSLVTIKNRKKTILKLHNTARKARTDAYFGKNKEKKILRHYTFDFACIRNTPILNIEQTIVFSKKICMHRKHDFMLCILIKLKWKCCWIEKNIFLVDCSSYINLITFKKFASFFCAVLKTEKAVK